jgi:hypothetical protein
VQNVGRISEFSAPTGNLVAEPGPQLSLCASFGSGELAALAATASTPLPTI